MIRQHARIRLALGYLADRVGPREVLIALAGVHALMMFAFILVRLTSAGTDQDSFC
jgi:nitrate/nitrite transporter NarK